jgi:signal transduction histidine kinase
MPVSPSALVHPELPVARHEPEPILGRVAAFLLTVGVGSYLVFRWRTIIAAVDSQWSELLFWIVLILVMNLLPIRLAQIVLTLDMPLLLGVALLYSPPVATLVAVVAAFDTREFHGGVPFTRALFNRSQIGLCVLFASGTFHAVAGNLEHLHSAALGTAAAVAAFHSTNVILVAAYTAWRGIRLDQVMRDFSIGRVGQFLGTYLGYGVLALVLARLFVDVGGWSVVMFLLPLVVARQAFSWGKGMQALSNRLKNRERLLERLFDRVIDERRDERQRISTDLHDDVLQSLIRISHLGSLLKREVPTNGVAEADAEQVVRVSQETIQMLRNVVGDLRTSPLGRGGLISTMRGLASDLQLDWGVRVETDLPSNVELPGHLQILLYQVAKEGIVNALKHSQSAVIRVRLWQDDSQVLLTVEDEGIGFDQESIDDTYHFGIGLMRERVRLAGGTLVLKSSRENGTRLWACLPVESESEAVPEPRRTT